MYTSSSVREKKKILFEQAQMIDRSFSRSFRFGCVSSWRRDNIHRARWRCVYLAGSLNWISCKERRILSCLFVCCTEIWPTCSGSSFLFHFYKREKRKIMGIALTEYLPWTVSFASAATSAVLAAASSTFSAACSFTSSTKQKHRGWFVGVVDRKIKPLFSASCLSSNRTRA